jgi:hypothetical protein
VFTSAFFPVKVIVLRKSFANSSSISVESESEFKLKTGEEVLEDEDDEVDSISSTIDSSDLVELDESSNNDERDTFEEDFEPLETFLFALMF